MEIMILVKYAPDRVGPLEVVEGQNCILEEDVSFVLGASEEMAMEEALSFRRKYGGSITAVSVGPEKDDEGLRYALSMGADNMVRLWKPGLAVHDPWAVADVIADYCKTRDFDVIIGGHRSADQSYGLVLNYLAAKLNMEALTGIVQIVNCDLDNGKIVVQRNAGKGDRWVVESPFPAVLGIEKSQDEPSYPTMFGRLKAQQTEVTLVNANGPAPKLELREFNKAKPKPKKIFTPDSNLSAADRMKMILSGGVSKKKSAGKEETKSGADQIMDALKQNGIIK